MSLFSIKFVHINWKSQAIFKILSIYIIPAYVPFLSNIAMMFLQLKMSDLINEIQHPMFQTVS